MTLMVMISKHLAKKIFIFYNYSWAVCICIWDLNVSLNSKVFDIWSFMMIINIFDPILSDTDLQDKDSC